MNYVDANILIYALVDTSEKGEKCRELLRNQHVVTNTLSLDEVGYKILKRSLTEATTAIRGITASEKVTLVPFLPEDVAQFKNFIEKGLYPRDAIHALTAVKMKCPVIYSEDPDFDKIAELKRKTPW